MNNPRLTDRPGAAVAQRTALGSGAPAETAPPWWQVGMVWLVLGGPALVVVASLGTAVVAYVGADEVLVATPSARHAPVQPTAQTPALTARNHAATAAGPGASGATPAAADR